VITYQQRKKSYSSEDYQKLLANRDSHGMISLEAFFELDTEDGRKEVEFRLTTDGVSACETIFQHAALSLNVDVAI
jgi:hypothetical protein